MFIKILTPNHNGKIELTVKDLEALIQEAVDKAIREKCASCSKCWQNLPNITYLGNQSITASTDNTQKSPYKITYTGGPIVASEKTIDLDGTLTTNNNGNFTPPTN